MPLDLPDLRRFATIGRVFAPAERGERVGPDGVVVVRELGRKRAAEKVVSRAIDEARLAAGADPMELNRRNSMFRRDQLRRARIAGYGPARSGRTVGDGGVE